MNFRLYDGTVRCIEHFDASSYERETDDPCLYCLPAQSGLASDRGETMSVTLDKSRDFPVEMTALLWRLPVPEQLLTERRSERRRLSRYPLVGHRQGLRSNDLVTLASAFWVDCNERGAVHS